MRCLIADDSALIRKKMYDILLKEESISGIDQAKNGFEVLEIIKANKPDVLLLDLFMPQMSGLEVLNVIMNDFPIPTIILSAVNPKNLETSVQALLIGAFDYIIKPESFNERISALFEKQLIEKIFLANKSVSLKKSELEGNSSFTKGNLRQTEINKTFEFGKYLNQLEAIKDDNILSNEPNEISIEKFEEYDIIKIVPEDQPYKSKRKKNQEQELKKAQKINLNPTIKVKNKTILEKTTVKQEELELLPRIDNKEEENKTIDKIYRAEDFTISDLKITKSSYVKVNIVVIGASVGGPKSIKTILEGIPDNFNCPILIVQHLNANFIEPFVNNLNQISKNRIKIAEDMEPIKSGNVYIAPGDKHMEIILNDNKPCIKIYEGKPVHYCMPSIDILFSSAAKVYKENTLGILLTGMGVDGVDGLGLIQKLGGITISESKETCVLYGMPRIAAKKGYAEYVLPNYKIKDYIIKFSVN